MYMVWINQYNGYDNWEGGTNFHKLTSEYKKWSPSHPGNLEQLALSVDSRAGYVIQHNKEQNCTSQMWTTT